MAHIGRFWELHFRRDLGIDLTNNNRGLARAYTVGASGWGGTVGGPLTSSFIRCDAVDELTFNGALWRSPFQNIGGRLIMYELETSISAGYPDYIMKVTVIDLAVGILVANRALRIPRADMGFIEAKQNYTAPTHPTILHANSPSDFFQAAAVRW